MQRVEITVVLDFMCPWSFIGMRCLCTAKDRFAGRLKFAPTNFVPFEFDAPGKYPPEGTDFMEYLHSCGDRSRCFIEEKIPRCFALGKDAGIEFSWKRRVYHTVEVNTALVLAQKHGVAEEFVLQMLSRHNEHLENPNDVEVLQKVLTALSVPEEEVSTAVRDPDRFSRNAEITERARRMLSGGGVPEFFVRISGGENLCAKSSGSPTTPEFFERIFESICSQGA